MQPPLLADGLPPLTFVSLSHQPLTRADVPDALYPTDNEWEVPALDLRMQADAVDLPVTAWGQGGSRKRAMPGTYHFYTEDYRFQGLWTDPTPLVNSGCVAAVEPNFSAYKQTPLPVALWGVYRKRYLARYWQSQGVRVFVDLNVAEPFRDLNLLGVPRGWRAYATRGYVDRLDATVREYEAACERAGTDDVLFWVYGGGETVRRLCGERGWIHVDEQRTVAKRAPRLLRAVS